MHPPALPAHHAVNWDTALTHQVECSLKRDGELEHLTRAPYYCHCIAVQQSTCPDIPLHTQSLVRLPTLKRREANNICTRSDLLTCCLSWNPSFDASINVERKNAAGDTKTNTGGAKPQITINDPCDYYHPDNLTTHSDHKTP